VPNRDASHCGTNAWQKIINLENLDDPIQHHRLRHSAMAAYVKKLFRHNPLSAQKLPIRVAYKL
jgi:hypothetical protein